VTSKFIKEQDMTLCERWSWPLQSPSSQYTASVSQREQEKPDFDWLSLDLQLCMANILSHSSKLFSNILYCPRWDNYR